MNQVYGNSEKSYRRGLVLGLSLAEIFLIFMFILLLIAAAIFAESKEEQEKLEQEISTYQEIKEFFVKEELTFEFVSELVQSSETIEEQKKINAELKKEIEQLQELDELAKQENLDAEKIKNLIEEKREKTEIIEENKRLEAENEQLKLDEELAKELEPLKELGEMIKEENLSADEAKKILAEKEEIEHLKELDEIAKQENLDAEKIKNLIEEKREETEIIEENKRLEAENKQLKLDEELAKELEPLKELGEMIKEENLSADEAKKILAEKKDTAALISENENLKTENTKLKIELKGQHPPCWYVIVVNEDGQRESFVPIYDIKITDTEFVVRERNVSDTPGIKQGNLNALPKISSESFNKELDANEFRKIFQPIFDAGNNKKIHDYSCRFSAIQYDFTSTKKIWQDNQAVVERLFFPGTEKELKPHQWPGR